MNQKPTLPKGMRDFGPEVMVRREYIFTIIKNTFKKFGYLPLETPTMENLSVLLGKYGDEGDKLVFKVLNSGDFLKKSSVEDYRRGAQHLTSIIAEKGLKYDLTVPFARYVVMNRNEINIPFRRYQIQPVWRADRPQKGRYREFYQCDADVVGTESLVCEMEIIQMILEVFGLLNIEDFTIKINHRKILQAITEYINAPGKETAFCVAIDKLDKIGKDGVYKELQEAGFESTALAKLDNILFSSSSNDEKLEVLASTLTSESGIEGIEDINKVFNYLQLANTASNKVQFDLTLARGLSYYTGCIFEVKVNNVTIGSVGGGGRYDNLTSVFGGDRLPGVGFSFGVDRIYDVLNELNLFPDKIENTTQVLITHFDQSTFNFSLKLLNEMRKAGISSEIYPDQQKLKKQLQYGNKKNIPYILIIGSEEVSSGNLTLKNMHSGTEEKGSINEIIQIIRP